VNVVSPCRPSFPGSCAFYRPSVPCASSTLTGSEDTPQGRWRSYDYAALVERDKVSLDLFWLKDDSLMDAENLPKPEVLALEIAEDLRSALEQIEGILGDLEGET
jgi:type I restriction enzyme M protein